MKESAEVIRTASLGKKRSMNTSSNPNGHAGWHYVHENLMPVFIRTRDRVGHARLSVAATPPLAKRSYLAFAQRQIDMLREKIKELPQRAADLNAEANRCASPGADPSPLCAACVEMGFQITILATWAEALWQTIPPVSLRRTHMKLCELPGAMIAQFEPYFATIAAAASGSEASGGRTHTIDLEQLADDLADSVAADAQRITHESASDSTLPYEFAERARVWRARRGWLGNLFFVFLVGAIVSLVIATAAPAAFVLTCLFAAATSVTALAWILAWGMS